MKVAVVGNGSAGRRHARILLALGHDVVAYDPAVRPIADVECAETFEVAVEGSDAVVIASPSSMHAGQARGVIERGISVLVEKPLATSASDAAELERLAGEFDVTLAVAMNLRHHPNVIRLRQQLAAGTVGRVLRASAWCGSWLPDWRPGTDYRNAYSAQAEQGGGVLLDSVVHELDYLLWMLGPARAVTAVVRRVSDLEIDVEDAAVIMLELACGAMADITSDYLDRVYDRGCRIVGDRSTACIAPRRFDGMYLEQMNHFLAAVRGEDGLITHASEARHVLEVIDAARCSSAEGRRIVI